MRGSPDAASGLAAVAGEPARRPRSSPFWCRDRRLMEALGRSTGYCLCQQVARPRPRW